MDFNDLTEEQKAKVRACETPEELHILIKEEGVELSIDDLDATSGGFWDNKEVCPGDMTG